MIRYRALDVPGVGAGAFMPVPTRNPVASSYGLVHTKGSPGVVAVPADAPEAVPSLTARGAANGGDGRYSAQGSDVSPDVILPCIYVALADNMGPVADLGVAGPRRRRNELPVRAVDPGRLPVPVTFRFPTGGRQLPQPRAFIRWPSRIADPGRATR